MRCISRVISGAVLALACAVVGACSEQESVPGLDTASTISARGLITADIGRGYVMDTSVTNANPAPVDEAAIGSELTDDTSPACSDLAQALNADPHVGGQTASAWLYRDFLNNATGAGVTEWIGAFADSRAGDAAAEIARETGSCSRIGLRAGAGQTTWIDGHALSREQLPARFDAGYLMRFPTSSWVWATATHGADVLIVAVNLPHGSAQAATRQLATVASAAWHQMEA